MLGVFLGRLRLGFDYGEIFSRRFRGFAQIFLKVVFECNSFYKVLVGFGLMVEAGERYRHFKGGEYEVVSVARNCDDAEQEVVVYRALYGDGGVWVREKAEFEGDKIFEDGRRVKRFELISVGGVRVKIKKLKGNAVVPRYAHEGDVALDLYSAEDYVVSAGKRVLVSTGIAIELSEGYFASIRGRSGLAMKKGICILGGVIEHGYRGEYGVVFLNTGDEDFVIRAGDRIAQVVIAPVASVDVEVVDELSDSVRGEGAFGSTGV